MVTYPIRGRLIDTRKEFEEQADKEEVSYLNKGESFQGFLKRHGLMPPPFMGQVFDEEQINQETTEALADPLEDLADH